MQPTHRSALARLCVLVLPLAMTVLIEPASAAPRATLTAPPSTKKVTITPKTLMGPKVAPRKLRRIRRLSTAAAVAQIKQNPAFATKPPKLGKGIRLTPDQPRHDKDNFLTFLIGSVQAGGDVPFATFGPANTVSHLQMKFSAAPNTSYFVDCEVSGDGKFTISDAGGSTSVPHWSGPKPSSGHILWTLPAAQINMSKVTVLLSADDHWSFRGCEVSPIQ